jgi:lipoprotein-anchoring transpeptidase ErfK/SrfK
MPIVAYFTKPITDSAAFIKATTVTVNGVNAHGAWYFEQSPAGSGHAIEAHYRPQNYWPGNATIKMNMPIKGLSGGGGYVFDDSLTLSIATGDAHTATVDANTLRMTVYDDGKLVRTMKVSLGAAKTPTFNGVKIVEQKGEDLPDTDTLRPQGAVRMVGTGSDHYNLLVPWSVRVTNSGEYIHAASWNGGNIGIRSTSNGCTNLNTGDAQWYYNFVLVGDPVNYVNTDGGPMPVWDGYGDWNVAWSTWQAGGLIQTTAS